MQTGINREFQIHTEAILLASELLSKCGVLWDQMAPEVEAFYLHIFTTIYGEVLSSEGREECWTVVFKMMGVIWREL